MLTAWNIKRLLLDLALKVSEQPFLGNRDNYIAENLSWKNDIALDSLEMLNFAAITNSFFNLLELDRPPYLLQHDKVDDWVELILKAHQTDIKSLNFFSSGTSGNVKTVNHTKFNLTREVDFLATLFCSASQIVSYVPSCNIYGFMFTVALPEKLNIPVLYPSEINLRQIPESTLIVATPFHWPLLLQNKVSPCFAVSAGSQLFDTLYENLRDNGLSLTEIYGSTENGGIAFRSKPKDPFNLFPYWELSLLNDQVMLKDKGSEALTPLMDHVEIVNPNTFKLLSRKDQKVNIAGQLTDLNHINEVISKLPNVKECLLSAKSASNQTMIQADLRLVVHNEASIMEIKKLIKKSLKPHEIPRSIIFSEDIE